MTGLISSRSSVVHKPFSLFCRVRALGCRRGREALQVLEDRGRVGFAIQPKCPAECPALDGQLVGVDGRGEPRSPARHDCLRIRHDSPVAEGDDTEEGGSGRATATADARSDGFHLTPCLGRTRSGTPGGPTPAAKRRRRDAVREAAPARSRSVATVRRGHSSPSRIESGWMSIRAPVSFAARRAFCPSLPIASDSW